MGEQDDTAGARSESSAMGDLATELFTLIRRHLKQFGLDELAQRAAFARSNDTKPEPTSGEVMRDVWGLAELLTEWSRAPEYLTADGRPKVLKIFGPGATFEGLVQRHLPNKPVSEVVELAKKTADIEVLPRKRVALSGSIMVMTTPMAPETLLAHSVRHIDFLLGTLTRNASLPAEDRTSKGYMERMVVGVIRKDAMADLVRQLRPQIYDLLLQFDTAVEQRAPKDLTDVGQSTTAAIGVYIAEDPDWVRTGIDPKPSNSSK